MQTCPRKEVSPPQTPGDRVSPAWRQQSVYSQEQAGDRGAVWRRTCVLGLHLACHLAQLAAPRGCVRLRSWVKVSPALVQAPATPRQALGLAFVFSGPAK